jgi:SAM-dependent methyltransferase
VIDRGAYDAVLDAVGILAGRRFLDAGCGNGELLALAASRGATVWGVDPSTEHLSDARRRLPNADLRLGELDDLPFDTGTFDVAVGFGANVVIAELLRVCRPGGMVGLATPPDRREAAVDALGRLGAKEIFDADAGRLLDVACLVAVKPFHRY